MRLILFGLAVFFVIGAVAMLLFSWSRGNLRMFRHMSMREVLKDRRPPDRRMQ